MDRATVDAPADVLARLTWGRLYMEDVESGAGIEAAVASLARGPVPAVERPDVPPSAA